ncbi:MAG: sigma-70 family RNA polymerase sigma factor, partial [Bacteroidota bacterium]
MKNETEITSANFEEVFKTYFGPLCNYVNSYINNWEGSREIVQGAFMKIWENKEDITITSSIKNYLYSTVRNRMIDGIRTDKKLEEYRNSISVDTLVENPKDLDPYLLREEILKAVDNLKPKMKKILRSSSFLAS